MGWVYSKKGKPLLKNKVTVDLMDRKFSTVIKVCTLFGLLIMVIFGLLYLFGLKPYVDIDSVVKYWGKPAYKFWYEIKGNEVNNYSWFLSHLGQMDSLSMVGIFFLTLTPLISVILIIPNAKKIFKILLLILVSELIFSVIKPFVF